MQLFFEGFHFHFTAQVRGELQAHENVLEYKWVNAQEITDMKDVAHGRWEVNVAKSFLSSVNQ